LDPVKVPLGKATLMVGRDNDSQIHLPDDQISRNHASIIYDEDQNFVIRDNGSTNGTYVNGERVKRCVLKHHDRVQFGEYIFLVDLEDSQTPDAETPPVQNAPEPVVTASTVTSPKKYRGVVNIQARPTIANAAVRPPLRIMLTEEVRRRAPRPQPYPSITPSYLPRRKSKVPMLLGSLIALIVAFGGFQIYRWHIGKLTASHTYCMDQLRAFERAIYRYRLDTGSFPKSISDISFTPQVLCEEINVPYRFVISNPRQGEPFAVVADERPHAFGHNVVFQDGRMAIVPAKDFDFFWMGVTNGHFYVRKEWERSAAH